MADHQWYYVKSTLLGESQEGPVSKAEFLAEIKAGHIKVKTLISSPTATKGQWHEAGQLPAIKQAITKVAKHNAAIDMMTMVHDSGS